MLGSGDTLRAFGTARFHDRHSMLVQPEWRLNPNRSSSTWRCSTTGEGGGRSERLDFDGLEHDSVSLPAPRPFITPLRVDLAKGRERSPHRLDQFSSFSRWSGAGRPGSRRRGLPLAALVLLACSLPLAAVAAKFYDETRCIKPKTMDASEVEAIEHVLRSDPSDDLFAGPRDRTKQPRPSINTIDEVPDSSWFTNRILAAASRSTKPAGGRDGPGRRGPMTVIARQGVARPPASRCAIARRLVHHVRRAQVPRGGHRRDSGREQDLLGARLLAGGNYLSSVRPDELDIAERHLRPAGQNGRCSIDDLDAISRGAHPAPTARIGRRARRAFRHARSAGSGITARVPTIRTTSSRTSIGASCAR